MHRRNWALMGTVLVTVAALGFLAPHVHAADDVNNLVQPCSACLAQKTLNATGPAPAAQPAAAPPELSQIPESQTLDLPAVYSTARLQRAPPAA